MDKEAVTNSSSLIFLAKLGRFDLLRNIFRVVFVPKQVIKEIFDKNRPENNIIKNELNNFIKEVKIRELKSFPIDEGESSALSLCLEKKIKIFLSDDKKARNFAQSLNIETLGTLGVLLENIRNKNLEKGECKALLKKLIELGFYLAPDTYSEILRLIDEA